MDIHQCVSVLGMAKQEIQNLITLHEFTSHRFCQRFKPILTFTFILIRGHPQPMSYVLIIPIDTQDQDDKDEPLLLP